MSDESNLPPDPASFRTVLGHFATGVTVITAFDAEPVGLAVNSFTSVSLDPPLVLWCAASDSSTWARIKRAGSFAINILSEHQEDVCRVFAQAGADRFSRVGWNPAPHTGSPLIHDALAYVDCTIETTHPGGDHEIVVGRVQELGVLSGAGPLIFYRGGYARLNA
ncbi:MAG: flavin reductase family protein [Acidimicrobiia bacterium]